jgi:hypothetical protein
MIDKTKKILFMILGISVVIGGVTIFNFEPSIIRVIVNLINFNSTTVNISESSDHSDLLASRYEEHEPYYLKINQCGLGTPTNSSNKNTIQLFFTPQIYDEKNETATVPFKATIFLEFWGFGEGQVERNLGGNMSTILIDPKLGVQQWYIDLVQPLDKTSQNYTKVRVNMTYFNYAPFDTTDQKWIAAPPPYNVVNLTLTELIDKGHYWEKSGNNTICDPVGLPLELKS